MDHEGIGFFSAAKTQSWTQLCKHQSDSINSMRNHVLVLTEVYLMLNSCLLTVQRIALCPSLLRIALIFNSNDIDNWGRSMN